MLDLYNIVFIVGIVIVVGAIVYFKLDNIMKKRKAKAIITSYQLKTKAIEKKGEEKFKHLQKSMNDLKESICTCIETHCLEHKK